MTKNGWRDALSDSQSEADAAIRTRGISPRPALRAVLMKTTLPKTVPMKTCLIGTKADVKVETASAVYGLGPY
jgi:hypothetical protein